MKTSPVCLPCFVQQSVRLVTSRIENKETRDAVLREILHYLAEEDYKRTPPEIAYQIQNIVNKTSLEDDPYKSERFDQNRIALDLLTSIRSDIGKSSDVFQKALKYCIAGNSIDLGVQDRMSRDKIESSILKASDFELDEHLVGILKSEIEKADSILYLGDNAGEIVFDMLFIEQLPKENICFVVRGKPVLNDVILQDTIQVGLDKIVEVIDNGSGIPGTVLGQCSDAFRKKFEEADLVIAKGQGNFETLNEVNKNIFFLLKIKCPVISDFTGMEIDRMAVIQNQ
jgi:damage-control phosphatase, subfamily I